MTFNKKSTKMIHFTNTRKDHIDKGYITFDKKYEKISMDELMNIIVRASHHVLALLNLSRGDTFADSFPRETLDHA